MLDKKHLNYRGLPGSIWLFPILCAVILLLLTVLRISGSSIGVYNNILYGSVHHDSRLVLNKPRPIRSDEWVWNSQMIMSQASNHYNRINPNLGNGQDMSLIIDVPYKDWSAVFRPQNLVFFILPFDYAFAFKWWLMAYLLLMACYFFMLFLLPKKRLVAASIAVALLFSPFVQWWYEYITLAPIYYSLFGLLVFMYLLRATRLKSQILLGLGLSYVLVCLALVLYPPFQIPCGLAVISFGLGYLLNKYTGPEKDKDLPRKLLIIIGSVIVAGLISLVFVLTRHSAVRSIEDTAYPGKRVVKSGGYDLPHLLSGNLDFQLQYDSKAVVYQIPKDGITNQSEDSNFVFLLPFLLLPSIFLLCKDRQRKAPTDWVLIILNLTFLLALVWMFIPGLDILGKITLLSKVPLNRMIIGLGLLNVMLVGWFIKRLSEEKKSIFDSRLVIPYCALILVIELLLAIHAKHAYPGYIGRYRAVAFSLPVPIIIYLLLRRRFVLASLGLAALGIFMTIGVNPLYRGTEVIRDTLLSKEIKSLSDRDRGKWAIENGYMENIALINNAPSLSGVYATPQTDIWRQIRGADPYMYNRFAHVTFNFYRDSAGDMATKLEQPGGDHFAVDIEPCSQFLKNNGVHFLLTSEPLVMNGSCLSEPTLVNYPVGTFYIYKID